MKIGFLINPVAGMGGRVGLKGTDDLAETAARLGAEPVAAGRAQDALIALKTMIEGRPIPHNLDWVTCSGAMGKDLLGAAGFDRIEVLYRIGSKTTAADTREAVKHFLAAGVELILFCGGDGTARDIASVVGQEVPILGIPSGVKMYSGVFGTTPERTARLVFGFLDGSTQAAEADLLDLDEERYRHGEWVARPVGAALTPYEPTLTQAAKAFVTEKTDTEVKADIAAEIGDRIEAAPETLFLLGPGSTVRAVADRLGIEKTLLGIDAVVGGDLVGRDLNERDILKLAGRIRNAVLVLSPIGAQGFVLGRGNLQLSPAVVQWIGTGNIVVVATPAKLRRTPVLHFDTGDSALDQQLAGNGFIPVITGYRRMRMVPVD